MSRSTVYRWISVQSIGLVPNVLSEASNNTNKLNTALALLAKTDTAMYIPPNFTCYFTRRIVVDSCMLFGEVGSRMFFNDGTESPDVGIFLQGYLPKFKSIDIFVEGATVRRARECVWVRDRTTGHVIEDVTVNGCSGAGFFVDGGQYGQIRRCKVKDNLADGFHHTNGSAHCEVTDCEVDGSGDDYFAVVSYRNQGRVCNNINHKNIKGNNQHHGGRGITVVGGNNISYKKFDIKNIKGYGVYVFAESSYDTYGSNNVVVDGGTIDGTGVNTVNPTQWAAVRIGDDNNQGMDNIRVENLNLYRIGGPTFNIDNRPNVRSVSTNRVMREQLQ